MSEIANTDQHAAWNGDSGHRWVADAVAATLRRAGYTDIGLDQVTVALTLGSDPADAADYLTNTGLGQAVLATIPDDQHPAAVDAVRSVLADHADADGVHLAAAIWIITATRTRLGA